MDGWSGGSALRSTESAATGRLLNVVDAGLCGILCVAPYFFGGRHDVGRLVFVSLVAVVSAAWFVRQSLLPAARWTRTTANVLLFLSVALLVLQLLPLPGDWLARLSPRTAELLSLWNVSGSEQGGPEMVTLGQWRTLSLIPHETTKSLAMLLSYCLLFIVVVQRIGDISDVRRLLRCIAISCVLMAGFGLLQFYTSDGTFFWFFKHPYRNATQDVTGSFINRNHYAHFLVLGIGPLVAWLLDLCGLRRSEGGLLSKTGRRRGSVAENSLSPMAWVLAATLALAAIAVVHSRSRGGAIAALVATSVLIAIFLARRIEIAKYVYGLVGLAVVAVVVLSLTGYYDKVAARFDDFTEGSVDALDQQHARRNVWAANLAAIQAGGLFGSGAGSHREIYRLYLPEYLTKEYTHAESGFLQIATENGLVGLGLLVVGLGICGGWGLACYRRAQSTDQIVCFGAVAGGLTASVIHSVFDFVWYIPACMSLTIVLAACLLRLAQLTKEEKPEISAQEARGEARNAIRRVAPCSAPLSRPSWWELTAVVVLVGGWSVHTYIRPAIAAVHWDRYLRASVEKGRLAQAQVSDLIANRGDAGDDDSEQSQLNEIMLRHLERVVEWDPEFARAQRNIASKYLTRFEIGRLTSENVLGLGQIRDAAMRGGFTSQEAKRNWLERVCGPDVELLYRAQAAARRAVMLCPLQGDAYINLSNLSFLNESGPNEAQLIAQAIRVRPSDADVLFGVGEQAFMAHDRDSAVAAWKKCFPQRGPHQSKIVYHLSRYMTADDFVSTFQPDWHILPDIWTRYREIGRESDLVSLLEYATEVAERQTAQADSLKPEQIWNWLANMYSELGRTYEALTYWERAYKCNPRLYEARRALARTLFDADRFAEAESHIRWCLARRPHDRAMQEAIETIHRKRLDQHSEPRMTSSPFPDVK